MGNNGAYHRYRTMPLEMLDLGEFPVYTSNGLVKDGQRVERYVPPRVMLIPEHKPFERHLSKPETQHRGWNSIPGLRG